MRRETGEEFGETTVWGQSKPLSLNRMRQYKDAIGLARERRKQKKLEESKVRIRNYVEPLAGDSLDIATWRGGGSDIRTDITVPLRQRYSKFMGTGDWNPAQIIQPEQAQALPSETRVIPDAGGSLEADFMPGPYGRAPVGGYRGIPMQRGVPLPEQEVTVGPPWTGAPWTGLSSFPTADPEYDLDLVMQTGGPEPNGGRGMELHIKSKKAGKLFYVYSLKFSDGTRVSLTSDVVQVPANTQTPIAVHISGATIQRLQGKSIVGMSLTFYAKVGYVGLRKKMIAQAKQGDI
jgi:hypothetical protein